MKVFITGANGYIGSSLCRHFLANGWEVHGLVRPTSDLHNLEGLSVQLHSGDLRHPESFSIPDGITHVIHSASIVSDMAGDAVCRDNILLLAVNLTAKLRAMPRPPQRLLYISTALVLGYNGIDISEQRPGESALFLAYTRYKVKTEAFFMQQWREHGLPVVMLRPGDVYGPYDRISCAKMLRGCERRLPLIVGHGNSRFGFCYIDNLCRASLLALTRPGIEGRAFTVTNGSLPSWRDFFSGLQRRMNYRQRLYVPKGIAFVLAAVLQSIRRVIPSFSPALNYYRVRRITTETTYDISSTITDLGYRPDDDFEKQLDETVAWYLREKKSGHIA